ncbi:MAG: CAP domain-containing protein [Verrucomicrobiota bacterium]|nr:CAP domain-containing protein [Verrucomicrobiota bacterium]
MLYSIGEPTNEEQAYLEMVNRARANPAAEGALLAATTDTDVRRAYQSFGVNLALMQTQMSALPALPPLSINPQLTTAARAHAQDMLANAFQDHTGSNGSSTLSRIAGTGYTAGASYSYGENVYSYSYSTFYGHASFEVDWGGTALTGGMQTPPGHRNNIHSALFKEVGIGIANGTNRIGNNAAVGPQLVAQDFGSRGDLDPFITGVVYQDRNGNGRYDAGEGIGGVTVNVANGLYYAVTSASGGYSVPIFNVGPQNVTFSGGGVPTAQRSVTVLPDTNLKLDYVTAATAPTPTPAPNATPTPAPTVAPPVTTTLGNISTRCRVGVDNDVMIGGFIIRGAGQKRLLIRAVGPSLAQYGVPDVLLNPSLRLVDSQQRDVAANDDWGTNANAAEIVAANLQPGNPRESALLVSVPEGSYTAIVSGVGRTTGAALVEVYDLDPTATAQLQNISTRAVVGANDNVMIGGIVVSGTGQQKVAVRAIGPVLTQFGIAGALANPTLRVVTPNGDTVIATNDDWASGPSAAELTARNLAPTQPAESAVIATLAPGGYTAIVSGVGNTTGVGLVEAYKIDN